MTPLSPDTSGRSTFEAEGCRREVVLSLVGLLCVQRVVMEGTLVNLGWGLRPRSISIGMAKSKGHLDLTPSEVTVYCSGWALLRRTPPVVSPFSSNFQFIPCPCILTHSYYHVGRAAGCETAGAWTPPYQNSHVKTLIVFYLDNGAGPLAKGFRNLSPALLTNAGNIQKRVTVDDTEFASTNTRD